MSLSKLFLDFISNVSEEYLLTELSSFDINAFVCGLELLDSDLQLCDTETCSKLILIIDSFFEKRNQEILLGSEHSSVVKLALQICVKRDVLNPSIYTKLFSKVLSVSTKMQLTSILVTFSPNLNVIKSSIESLFALILEDLKEESSETENSNILVNALFDVMRVVHSKNLQYLLKCEADLFFNKIVEVDELNREKLLNVVSCLISSEIDSFDNSVNTSLVSSKMRNLLLNCLCFKTSGIVRKKARFCSLKMNLINFDVWLLLETLEEKQRHLIEPLLATKLNFETTSLDCIKNKDQNERNLLEVVIERMLCHDNKHIRRYAFAFVSKSVFKSNCGISHRFLLETCVCHLQDNAIYTSDESVFSLKFLNVLPLGAVLERLVQLQGNLSPIAIYHILKQVSEDPSVQPEEHVNKTIVKNLVVIIFAICADVCVRAAIQVLLVKAIIRRCPEDVIDVLLFVNEGDVNLSHCLDTHILNASMVRIDKYLDEISDENVKLIARFFGVKYEKCCNKTILREINEALQRIDDSMIEVFLLQMLQVVIHVEIQLWRVVKNHMKSMNTLKIAVILSKKSLEEDVKQELIAFLGTKLKLKEISWDYMAVMCELLRNSECNEVCKTLCDTIDFWLRENRSLQCFKEECFWICLIFYTKYNCRMTCSQMLCHFELISRDECCDMSRVKDALYSLIAITPITFNRYLINFYGLMFRNELLANNCSSVSEHNDQPISRLFCLLSDQLFSACLELKKNEFWKETFHSFITEFAFREELFVNDSQDVNLECDQRYTRLQLLDILDISASLIRHLSSVVSKNGERVQLDSHSQLIFNILIDGITFTRFSVNQLDLIAKEIGENANISDCLLVANPFNFHHKTRLSVLELLSNLNRYEIIVRVTHLLIEKENQLLQETKYSFLNSTLHRTQTKIWQFHFLILQRLLNDSSHCLVATDNEWATFMFSFAADCLINQQKSQMSVQILQQLIVIQLLLSEKTSHIVWPLFYEILQFDSEEQLFDEKEKKLQNSRIGSLVPFLSIVYHLIDKKPQLKYFPISCLLSCQHYKVRLLSHLVLQKATTLIDIISSKYKFLIPPIPRGSANVNRNLSKIRRDWFYSAFDPENDCTLQFVLHYLPKLSNCCEEDIIPLDLINSSNFNKAIKLSNPKSVLQKASPSALRDKFVEETKTDVLLEKSKEVFQKKYSVAEMCFNVKREANEGLIVCATLLDRAPNLGGLCRTCEVFGVRKLVISNASILEDKDFVQLSVSSQKWVSIEEVKKNELSSYLTAMRRDHGYTLIAVEQTTGSKSLNNYKFPQKSLIILGNEREGLPVEYLHQVNECIEIPQSGLIRSLNVHVTGAIIIWEYYKQMMESCDS